MLKQSLEENSKYLKYWSLFLVPLIIGSGALLWYFFSTGYYSVFPVTFSRYDYPCISVQLQNQTCILAIDVGSRFPLSLHQKTLDAIGNKQLQGTITVHNVQGEKHETPSYLIPHLQLGSLELKNILAHQYEEEEYGTLGKCLGEELNLLLDFPHSRIIASNTFAALQKKQITDKNWIRVPFERGRYGIIFHVDTDFGMRKLGLNTTSTLNLLRSSLIPRAQPRVSSSFLLGGRHYGSVTFESIDLPPSLDTIDGFIGMDFLKEHAIYLDCTHKIAYFEPPKPYFEHIPVTFDNHNIPMIDVSIESNVYPMPLDLGSSFPVTLQQEILQNIRNFKYGTATWHDFRGERYESPTYTLPEVRINNLKLTHVLTKEDREDFHANVTLRGTPIERPGVIGLPFLQKYNLLFDFPHSAIYASTDRLLLQNAGLFSENLLAIPFTVHPDGILLTIETDHGSYRLILDTGSTYTVIRAPHPADTTRFCIMGHDFGNRSIRELDICTQFDWDGLLGMDFLGEYPIFIDYSNKIAFIDLDKGR